MTRFFLAVLGVVGLLLLVSPAQAFEVEELQHTGSSGGRLDLVILGDGYTEAEQEKMSEDAEKVMNAFWSDTVFGAYREFVNVSLVHVVSNESGADQGSAGEQRDTALGAHFFCAGIERLLCVDDGAVRAIAMSDAPEFDQLLVIVNDLKYGGAGGGVATTSMASSAFQVPIHEVGHSLFGLADEYGGGGNAHDGECSEINVTRNSDLATVKWDEWTDLQSVGLFEGGHYHDTGHYRPTLSCKMRHLGSEFGPICREAAVLAILEYGQLIDGLEPSAESEIEMTQDEVIDFRVSGPSPQPTTLRLNWMLDELPFAEGDERSLSLSGQDLEPGEHRLEVFLTDESEWVRASRPELLSAEAEWRLRVLPPEVPPATGGAMSGTGGDTSTGGAQSVGGDAASASTGGNAEPGSEEPRPGVGGSAASKPESEMTSGCACTSSRSSERSWPWGLLLFFLPLGSRWRLRHQS